MALLSDEVRLDLQNWSRWLNAGPWPHPLPSNHAGSAEGNYTSPSDLGDDDADNPPPPPRQYIDVERAQMLDGIFHKRLTPLQRKVLAAEFPNRQSYMVEISAGTGESRWLFDRAAAIRKCGTTASKYREALRRAAVLIGEEMSREATRENERERRVVVCA